MKRTTTDSARSATAGATAPPWEKGKKTPKDRRGSPEAIKKRLATMRRNKKKKALAKANGEAHRRAPVRTLGSQRFLAVQRACEHVEEIDRLIDASSKNGSKIDLRELRIQTLLALKELRAVS